MHKFFYSAFELLAILEPVLPEFLRLAGESKVCVECKNRVDHWVDHWVDH